MSLLFVIRTKTKLNIHPYQRFLRLPISFMTLQLQKLESPHLVVKGLRTVSDGKQKGPRNEVELVYLCSLYDTQWAAVLFLGTQQLTCT